MINLTNKFDVQTVLGAHPSTTFPINCATVLTVWCTLYIVFHLFYHKRYVISLSLVYKTRKSALTLILKKTPKN